MSSHFSLLPAVCLLMSGALASLSASKPASGYEPGRILSFRQVVVMDTVTAVLHGQVISLCDKKALPATVRLIRVARQQDNGVVFRTQASAKGEFRFFHVPAGSYQLWAACRGYGALQGDTVRLGPGDGSEVKIGLGCRVAKLR